MNPAAVKDHSSNIHKLPSVLSFTGEGFFGYAFGPLQNKDMEVLYIESEKGHDTVFISKKMTRAYYILAGTGYFTMDGSRCEVRAGMLVEVPPKTEYTYSGKMTMVVFGTPRWVRGNEIITGPNPDVLSESSFRPPRGLWATRLDRLRGLIRRSRV